MPRSTLAIQEAPWWTRKESWIGINTAIASRTGSYSGYSFAVPANLAAKVSRDLIEFGEVQRAFLGVHIRPVDEGLARDLGLPDVSGVMVTGLTKEGLPKPACRKAMSSSRSMAPPPRPCLCSWNGSTATAPARKATSRSGEMARPNASLWN